MKKRVLSALLALAMVVSSTPARVFAADGEAAGQSVTGDVQSAPQSGGQDGGQDAPQDGGQPAPLASGSITYLDADGNQQTYEGEYTPLTDGTTSWENGWYLVEGEVTVLGIQPISGDVTLVLANEAQLDYMEPLKLESGGSLTITAQSKDLDQMGGMEIFTGEGSAVSIASGASLTINGGGLTSKTGSEDNISCDGSLTVNGGSLSLWTGDGKGISGNGSVTVTGGRVETHSARPDTTVIDGSRITISGGVVVANGGMGVIGEWDSCSTGENGNAMIYAASFSPSNPNASYILFGSYIGQYESIGEVYGNVTLDENLTLESKTKIDVRYNASLTIPAGVTLTVTAGSQLANSGSIINNGTILIEEGGSVTGKAISGNPIMRATSYFDPATGASVSVAAQQFVPGTALEGGWYLVEGNVTFTGTLSISRDKRVNLILADGAHLTLERGLSCGNGVTLSIWAQSTGEQMGKLTAKAGLSVGGNSDLLIHGGAIDAGVSTGGGSAAVRGGNVTITGGVITAIATSSGQTAGIYATDKVAISGGSITATGSGGSAGIHGYSVAISGGSVRATGGEEAAADILGKFSTGEDGHAVIYAGTIADQTGIDGWDCIWFASDTEGKVCGSVTLGGSLTVQSGETLTVPAGTSLTRPEGVSLVNEGGILVKVGGSYTGEDTSPNPVEYEEVFYLDENGETQQVTGPVQLLTAGTTALESGWYLVSGDLTLPDRLIVRGEVHLILEDKADFNATKGIETEGDAQLTITAQSKNEDTMGSLTATGADLNPGIGGNGDQFAGTVIINGGRITASADNGAGIGGIAQIGGSTPSEGAIIINGGVVNATGGGWAAGIGIGGNNGSSVAITINGGEVTAVGGEGNFTGAGAGIGTRENSTSGFTITINGGRVHATSRNGAAGIGCGAMAKAGSLPGRICITGGTVIAEGAQGTYGGGAGAGIGDGQKSERTDRVTIEISGGVVTAAGGEGAADIGDGNVAAGTSFSTGEGNAIIHAATITGSEDTSGWNCIWFESEGADGADGSVFGEVTLDEDLTIGAERTLTVEPGATLTVPAGVSLTNNGTIKVELDGSYSGSQPAGSPVEYYVGWDADEDGAAEQADYLAYGTEPVYSGAEPVKENTAQYTYTFSGWSPAVAAVTGPELYKAQFDAKVNRYTVTLPTEQTGYTLTPLTDTTLDWGGTFAFTLTAKPGYTLTEGLAVRADGQILTEQDGSYTLTLTGNTAITVEGVADVTAPDGLTVSYGSDAFREFMNGVTFGLFFKDTVTVTFSAADAGSGVDAFTYALGGGAVQTVPADAAGMATIRVEPEFKGNLSQVTAVDKDGNATDEVAYEYFAVEKDAPSAPVADAGGYTGGWTAGDVTVTLSGSAATSGIAKYQYQTGDGVWRDLEPSEETAATQTAPANVEQAQLTISESGTYRFRAVSNAGNLSQERSVTVQIDKTLPVITAAGHTDDYRTGDTVTLTVSAGPSGVAKVEVQKDGGSREDITGSYVGGYEVTANGTYTFRVTNGAGVSAENAIRYDKLDAEQPQLTVSTGEYAEGSWARGDVTITATTTGNIAPVAIEYQIDGGGWQAYTGPVVVNEDTTGRRYTFRATSASGVASETAGVTVKRDAALPEGGITIEENTFKKLINEITFGLFFNKTVEVRFSSADAASGVASTAYLRSETILTGEELQNRADWTEYSGPIFETAEDAKTFVYYGKVTDNAGNLTVFGADGVVFDTTAPVFAGAADGGVYYTTQQVTAEDANLDSVTLNGKAVTSPVTLAGDTDAVYTVEATDKAGNRAAFTLTMKPIAALTDPAAGLSDENATSEDRAVLEGVRDDLDRVLAGDAMTDGERQTLTGALDRVNAALDRIEAAAAAGGTEAIDKVETIDPDNAKPTDKEDLETAKEDLENALDNFGGNYTEEERKELEDALDRVNDALDRLEQAGAAQDEAAESAGKVEDIAPDTVQPGDREDLETAKEDLENALDSFGDNYTEEERKELEDALDRVNEALESLDRVETLQDAVDTLPDTLEPDDLETAERVEAVKEQYDRLTDHEKELAAAAGEKLDALLDAAGAYRILSGDGSSWTQGGSDGVTIVANGAPERLIDLLLDGNSIDPAQVTVEKGSTIVTLKPAYLATLAAGQHTLTFVYENGQVSATFTIAASGGESGGAAGGNAGNTAAGSPNTGDTTNPVLWVVVAAVCIGALVALVVWRRRDNAQR